MPQGHGVDNCSLRFCRRGRQLDFGEGRSPTQFSKRNLHPVFHQFWAYAYAFGPGLMIIMVIVLVMVLAMVMVMMTVMVMVPKALRQVGWLRQLQCQSINRLKPSIGQSFHKLRIQSAQRFLWKCYSCRSSALSSVALKQALKQALKSALNQTLNQALKPALYQALKPARKRPRIILSMSVSAPATTISSQGWLRFVDCQLYIVP